MTKENIPLQAKVYLFHLNNATKENGLKKDENWKLSIVDEAGKTAIENVYFPTVSVQVAVKGMEEFLDTLLQELKVTYTNIPVPDTNLTVEKGAEYFIAYSPQRIIR